MDDLEYRLDSDGDDLKDTLARVARHVLERESTLHQVGPLVVRVGAPSVRAFYCHTLGYIAIKRHPMGRRESFIFRTWKC